MLKITWTDIVMWPFLQKKQLHEGQWSAPVSVPQRWFWKLLGIQKKCLLGEVFELKLSRFSENYFPLPQSTYFVIAPLLDTFRGYWKRRKRLIHNPTVGNSKKGKNKKPWIVIKVTHLLRCIFKNRVHSFSLGPRKLA